MRCDRCGRENPDHLTFCEDCGYAIGRARREVASAPPASKRPPAPDFGNLAPREVPRPAAVPPPVALAALGATCPACRTKNEPGHRFCITCGSSIDAGSPAELASTAPETGRAASGNRPPTVPDGVAAAAVAVARLAEPVGVPIASVRMVPIGDPTPPPTPAIDSCPRCRTPSPPGALYCRVCGYSLAEPQTRRDPSAPAPFGGTVRLSADAILGAEATPLAPHPAVTPLAVPAPVAGPRPAGRVVLLEKDGTDRSAYPLSGDTLDIGAREGNVLLDADPFLSSRHARIVRDPGTPQWYVVDLESVNGVYIKLRGRWPLADGDLILLGQQVLRFDTVKDAEHGLGPATQHGTALFGTPPMPRLARLCQRTVEGVTRDVFHIHRAETSLGRETADIVFTDDPFLSRRHAVITHDPTTRTFHIEDAGSSNGTYVAIRGRAPISDGDILRMGLHVFRIELQAAAASTDTSARS